ncbi:CLUMA_CG002666, isoform B [Clunio marinus]|uniref:CLUMA_CG002666, isoform B n=1 Tax=Clunio marinus TaxID=568069 RepID=A0A1J1HNC6_9DIPT|nr:CLUMA_CG002666, isoform B [Clunio marinus]
MNETQCTHLIESVEWTEPKNIISLAILGFINILVIVGNCLVIAAVFCSHKLRSVTNFFIVSLAVADLLVGLAVLPFSATWEVFKVWIFGDVWCKVWLAVDVLLCTASILNLCAISLDRYVAVTRPVTYPSIMSTRRAKSLIAGLWVLSFVICFPPLIGWRDNDDEDENTAATTTDGVIYHQENHTLISVTTPPSTYVKCPWTCELTNDAGYVVYSALGSFYIPMLVMLFFYWRIYRAAIRTTRAINQGFRTTKGKGGKNNPVDEENVTLRIHRGNKNQRSDFPLSNSTTHLDSLRKNQTSVTSMPSFERKKRHSSKSKDKVTISISYPSNDHITSPTMSTTSSNQASMISSSCSKEPIALRHSNSNECHNPFKDINSKTENTPNIFHKKAGKRTSSGIKVQVRKFRMETKAAKTLAIIVGSKGIGNRFEEQRLTLRIHRGRGSNYHESPHSNGSTHSTTTSLGSASPERLSRFTTRKHEKVKISVSYPSSENISTSTNNQPSNQLYAVHYTVNGKDTQASHLFRGNSTASRRSSHASNIINSNNNNNNNNKDFLSVNDKAASPRASKKMGKRNIKAQVKKFRMETKAAKTLAIIVGLFILCWLPFFTLYLIRPFCEDCINQILFSVVFWIGYCNSAINPMIYALFSKDFRFAFKRIICKCFCSGPGFNKPSSRRGSDMSAFRHHSNGQRTPSISPSQLAHSIGDDSDPLPDDANR